MTLEKLLKRQRAVAMLYAAQVKRCAQIDAAEEFELAAKLRSNLRRLDAQLELRSRQRRVHGRATPGVWPPPEARGLAKVLRLPVAASAAIDSEEGGE